MLGGHSGARRDLSGSVRLGAVPGHSLADSVAAVPKPRNVHQHDLEGLLKRRLRPLSQNF